MKKTRQTIFKESGVFLSNKEWMQLLCKVLDAVESDISICSVKTA